MNISQKESGLAADPFGPASVKLLIVILILGVFAVYFNSLFGAFVWDDQTIVLRNSAIRSFKNIPYIFKNEFAEMAKYNGNIYRPMQELSYMADFFLYGTEPIGFHITSVALQAACVCLVFLAVFSINGSKAVAFLTALVFGVHPVNTEAVSYISGRSDPLYLLFLLGSFLLYIKSGEPGGGLKPALRLGGAVVFFSLSLLSRETAVVFPLVLICYEIFAVEGPRKKNLFKIIPFVLVLILYAILRFKFIEIHLAKAGILQPKNIFFTDIKVIAEYLRLLVYPAGLHMERRIAPANSIVDGPVILSIAVIGVAAAAFFAATKNNKKILFWLLWFIVFLLPNLNIIGLNALLAEHWLFGASIGMYAAVFGIFFAAVSKYKLPKWAAYLFPAVVVVYLSILTVVRNTDWKDEPSIYQNTLRYTPSPKVLSNLGVYYELNKEYDKSIEVYIKALSISPNEPWYHNNIAVVYLKTDRVGMAIEHWRKSLRANPNQPEIKKLLRRYGG